MRIMITILTAIALCACASAGRRIDRTHIESIENGVHSKAQVRSWFGEPYSVRTGLQNHPSGCVERWTYEYAEAQGFGTVTYQESLVVDFDAASKVCDHAFAQSGED